MPKELALSSIAEILQKQASPKLIASVGAACAAALMYCVPIYEGTILKGYRDPIGIVTACTGHTKTAQLGKKYTQAECDKLLQDDLLEHAEGVKKCLKYQVRDYQLTAFVSFAYNVGVPTFCASTLARKFNAGDVAGACAELSRWVWAGSQVLPGLVTRRAEERKICEGKSSVVR